jgi:hypothetical protein
MSHFVEICEFGKVHAQCRCIGPKLVKNVKCNMSDRHGDEHKPKHRLDVDAE